MIWLALCIVFSLPSYAQFLPDLQAKTPEEYDAYLDVLDGPELEKGTAFESRFPDSALRLPVCELLTRAFRANGDAVKALAAAARGLAVAPDYIPLLVELADLQANSAREWAQAADPANRALALLDTVKASRRIAPEDWLPAVAALRARAHGALGLVRFKNNDPIGAIKEFEAGLAVESKESPALHYRLGRLYGAMGRRTEARQHLEKAAANGEKALRELARAALAELR